ncbi:MAG: hypothetical protein AAFU73_17345 [Planctomycetota bacterium]
MSADLPEPHGEPALPSDWVEWIDRADGAPSQGAVADGERARALERARAHARLLRSLPRLEAPASLEGAVVAALHAGHTEDRVRDQIVALRPVPAPAALDAAVAAAVERAVEADPVALRAPARLDGMVAEAVGSAPAPSSAVPARRQQRAVWVSMAAAAALVAGVYLAVNRAPRGAEPAQPRVASFIELVPVQASDLSPADRAVLQRFGAQLRGGRS